MTKRLVPTVDAICLLLVELGQLIVQRLLFSGISCCIQTCEYVSDACAPIALFRRAQIHLDQSAQILGLLVGVVKGEFLRCRVRRRHQRPVFQRLHVYQLERHILAVDGVGHRFDALAHAGEVQLVRESARPRPPFAAERHNALVSRGNAHRLAALVGIRVESQAELLGQRGCGRPGTRAFRAARNAGQQRGHGDQGARHNRGSQRTGQHLRRPRHRSALSPGASYERLRPARCPLASGSLLPAQLAEARHHVILQMGRWLRLVHHRFVLVRTGHSRHLPKMFLAVRAPFAGACARWTARCRAPPRSLFRNSPLGNTDG